MPGVLTAFADKKSPERCGTGSATAPCWDLVYFMEYTNYAKAAALAAARSTIEVASADPRRGGDYWGCEALQCSEAALGVSARTCPAAVRADEAGATAAQWDMHPLPPVTAPELLRQSVRVAVSSAVDAAHLLRSHVDGTGVCAGGGSGGVLQDSPNATTWTLEPDLLRSEASSSEHGQGEQISPTYSGVPTGLFHIKNTVSERPAADCSLFLE